MSTRDPLLSIRILHFQMDRIAVAQLIFSGTIAEANFWFICSAHVPDTFWMCIKLTNRGQKSLFATLLNYEQESLFNIDLHATSCCAVLHHVSQRLHSFWGLSKDLDIVDEFYVLNLIAVVGVLTAVFLVLANLRTMADTLILPSRRGHPQQSVNKDIEQLQGRDVSLRYACIKCDSCTFCVLWSETGC